MHCLLPGHDVGYEYADDPIEEWYKPERRNSRQRISDSGRKTYRSAVMTRTRPPVLILSNMRVAVRQMHVSASKNMNGGNDTVQQFTE